MVDENCDNCGHPDYTRSRRLPPRGPITMRTRTRKRLAMTDRERADWKRWCQEAEARAAREARFASWAWTLLCNVNGGDWEAGGTTDEWRAAARRWGDEYHAVPRAPEPSPGWTVQR